MRNIDQLRARLGFGQALSDENPQVESLRPAEVPKLRLPWLSHFSPQTLAAHVDQYPGMAFWVPATSEYIVSQPWRHRDDISEVVEVTARKGRAALVHTLSEQLREDGVRLLMLSEEVWRDQTRLYMDLGFDRLETIVFFERDLSPNIADPGETDGLPNLEFSRLEPAQLDSLMALDHSSFPWLWWNGAEEFVGYMQTPGVHIYLASHEGTPVGYASYTVYQGWAHLDRLAVIEKYQGRKFGAAQLVYALRQMAELGASSVGLSTQLSNVKSHALYSGFGFRQAGDRMHFYGLALDPELRLEYVAP